MGQSHECSPEPVQHRIGQDARELRAADAAELSRALGRGLPRSRQHGL